MRYVQWGVHFLVRSLLVLVPLGALALLGFVAISFVSAQLNDVPEKATIALIKPAAEQPLNLSPDALELRLLGFYLRMQDQLVQAPASTDGSLRAFSIEQGETASSVSARLQEEGLISDAELFRLYMRYHGIDQRLAAGRFALAPNMPLPEIAEKL
jgi:hypothetical protein